MLSAEFGEGKWKDAQKFASVAQEARIVTVPMLLVKPQTYMNLSGEAVKKIVDFYKLNGAEQVLIVSDDIDIPLGTVRMRASGGPGTHNGLKSVVEQLGENFHRLRIGIGPKPENVDLSAWVLSRFSAEEQTMLDTTLKTIPDMVKKFVMEQPAKE